MKFQSILHCHIDICSSSYEPVLWVECRLVGQCPFGFVIHISEFSSIDVNQNVCYDFPCIVHPYGVRLHDSRVVIYIYNEPGERIAFAVYKAVGGVLRISCELQPTSHVECSFEFSFPEFGVNLFVLEGQDSHCY